MDDIIMNDTHPSEIKHDNGTSIINGAFLWWKYDLSMRGFHCHDGLPKRFFISTSPWTSPPISVSLPMSVSLYTINVTFLRAHLATLKATAGDSSLHRCRGQIICMSRLGGDNWKPKRNNTKHMPHVYIYTHKIFWSIQLLHLEPII